MQKRIDDILNQIPLPLLFRFEKHVEDEYCLFNSELEDAIKLYFCFPLKYFEKGSEKQFLNFKEFQDETKFDSKGLKITSIKISDAKKTLDLEIDCAIRFAFTLQNNRWRIYKKNKFHIECFEDYLEVW